MRNSNLMTEILMLRYLIDNPQSYKDLNPKVDFSTEDTKKAFLAIRKFDRKITPEELSVEIGNDATEEIFSVPVTINPDKVYTDIIKYSVIRYAYREQRTDIIGQIFEEIDNDDETTDTVWTDWFSNASIIDISAKLNQLNIEKVEKDKKIINLCRGGLTSIIKPFDMDNEEVEPENFIIDGIMTDNNIGNIIGQSKAGKSYFVEELAFCLENGIPWGGREVRQAHCILLDFELTKHKLKTRFNKLFDKYSKLYPDKQLKKPVVVDMLNYMTKLNLSVYNLIDYLREYKTEDPDVEVAILDPFYLWFDGDDENNNDQVKECLMKFMPLKSEGWSIIYTHHTPRISNKSQRETNPLTSGAGASAHGRLVDFAIGLKTNDYESYVSYYKGRERDGHINFRRTKDGFFQYDATEDSEYEPITKEEAEQIKELLNSKRQDKGKMRIDDLLNKLPELKGKKLDDINNYGLVSEKIKNRVYIRTREGF